MAIAYAQNALCFVFLNEEIKDKIKGIYLYGSAVRGELTKDSDIDIFIDSDESVQKIAEASLGLFYESKDYDKWRLSRFTHPISIQSGIMDEWQLNKSIGSEGLALYSTKIESGGTREVIFTIEMPKIKKDYLKFTREMFGRKEKGYKGSGLLGACRGNRLGTNTLMVPNGEQKTIKDYLNRSKVRYSLKEIIRIEP